MSISYLEATLALIANSKIPKYLLQKGIR